MKTFKKRSIPLKNYIYSALILIGIILLIMYIFSWYQVKKEEKILNSYLINSKTIEFKIDNLSDLEQSLSEAPLSYFVLVSYTGDENTYNIEKKLKRIIDKYKLNDIFYYVDATKSKDNGEYIDNLSKIFNTKDIKFVPVLIYVEEGKTKEVLNDITVDSVKNILEKYDFKALK